jgi:hypothetical protein
VQIVCLQKYRSGYRGFLQEPERWVMFQFSRRAGLRRLAAYARSDFDDYAHFIGMMGRFVPANRFLPIPVRLERPDMDGFDQLWETLAKQVMALTGKNDSDN